MSTFTNTIKDLKAFVPSKEFDVSTQFYKDLGFTMISDADVVREFEIGKFRFLLQNFHVAEWANNSVMQLEMDDLDSWVEHVNASGVEENYESVRVAGPMQHSETLRILHVVDPAGVCWNFTENG